ncbi:MAG: hypothetical protein EKK41_23635 [Hyphomicrobiales bacterium]|nr:MAG: hypothetical protein EKK41_23635 [Hyphomicrobiales bacterium]
MPSQKARVQNPDEMEDERSALLNRLQNLDPRAKSQPGYRTALSLLNSKFRKSTIGARVAVLQAAAFMIEVLEKLPL